jgi:hypothetical protein
MLGTRILLSIDDRVITDLSSMSLLALEYL